jgi:FkbM family methyltransferase
MAAVHPEPLVFNHATGQLFSADGWTRLCVAALAGLTKLTAPLGYHGLSHACRSLRWALPRRDLIVTLTPDALFTAPLGDPYWTRLLNRRVLYEPEIAAFLRMVADVDYDFIDCGANFGYWSILASSKAYGGHRAVAIEPAKANVRRLDFNARLNGSRFAVLHRAVGEVDKARAWLSGRKHEGMTVVGEGGPGAESVSIVSLDRLLDREAVAA